MSDREYEVFGHLGMGLSNQEIARRLVLSERTVKAHVGRVVKKLGFETRTAACLAAQLHLLRMCPFGQLSYSI
ncbi:response regulator transcription factor [Kitasatospora sp. NBC_00315]|uniref:response regulator transcription factor n=1 Tax=Kitasatospora sp. NBC_00315 TaxID=2975963 RepID=UPI003251E1E2